MFSGIIETLGSLQNRQNDQGKELFTFRAEKIVSEVAVGESVAVDGVCLTVVHKTLTDFSVHLSSHSLGLTLFNNYKLNQIVNLERSIRLGERLSGHIVQGHVDGWAELKAIDTLPDSYNLLFQAPKPLQRYISHKGSISLNGISLTIATKQTETFGVAVVPHTWSVTNLQFKKPGDLLHLETDLIARYLEALQT